MKWIQNKVYSGLVILGLSIPLQVHAAGRDMVVLSQDGSKAVVSLEMSNAEQEKITTVALSLDIQTDSQEQISVDFQFSPELSGTEHGFVYHKDTGRLDVYVASAKSLFREDTLKLGSVQVLPADENQIVSADISYCKNSFQTANGAYGDKTPVVEGEVAPVTIQAGNGTLDSSSDTNPGGADNIGTGSESNNAASVDDNRNQGLYDETTQFVNNPASAQLISSPVVKSDSTDETLTDMSVKAPPASNNRTAAGNSSIGRVRAKGKVSVIAPEDGPASILVSGKESGISEGDSSQGLLAEMIGAHPVEEESNSEEILLDQKSGGAIDNRKNEKRNRIIAAGIVLAGSVAAGTGIFVFVKKKSSLLAGAKKKKRKKRKRPVKKRSAGRKRRPVRKEKRRK